MAANNTYQVVLIFENILTRLSVNDCQLYQVPTTGKMHQLEFGQCLFWVPHREIEVFYEGSSDWQRARPVPNLRVTMVMMGAGGKWRWGQRSFFLSYICVSSYIPLLLFIFSVFISFPGLCPFPSMTSSWNLSLSRPSLSPYPLPHSPSSILFPLLTCD